MWSSALSIHGSPDFLRIFGAQLLHIILQSAQPPR